MLDRSLLLASPTLLRSEARVSTRGPRMLLKNSFPPPFVHLFIRFSREIGTQRRKKKHVNVQNVNEDKKLKSAIKKFGRLSSPQVEAPFKENMANHNFHIYRRSASAGHRGGEYVQG